MSFTGRLLIIGGSDAGIAAALRARECAPIAEVTVLVADEFPNFSICGLPYWLGGEVGDWHDLAHRTIADLEASGMRLRLAAAAVAVDPARRRVTVRNADDMHDEFSYDRLIVATGAEPVRPAFPGVDLPGVHLLHHMHQAFALDQAIRDRQARSAVIIGAGYIGLEMAEALRHRRLAVTVVRLAADAGAELGVRGALRVDTSMKTTLPDVWAAGDCVHTHHRLLPEPSYLPLGTTAHKQGRVAGENAVDGRRLFAGSLGTQVVKVFQLAIARTGLRDDEARNAGLNPRTVATTAPDHKPYYPGAHELHMRWTADADSDRLLGCQIAGHRDAQVAKRIDTAATALFARLTADQISDQDLSYSPPFGSPWDALQIGAQALNAKQPGEHPDGPSRRHAHPR